MQSEKKKEKQMTAYFLPNLMVEPVELYLAAKKRKPPKKEKRSKPGREKKKPPKKKKEPTPQ
jgi:hypothetical protein